MTNAPALTDPAIAAAKASLRAALGGVRARATAPLGGEAIRDHFTAVFGEALDSLALRAAAGYWPMAGEADLRPLLHRLHDAGWRCGLPVVVGRGRPLLFRAWQPGDALLPGVLGIPTPAADAAIVEPVVVLVPLVAFDAEGWRLGHGRGYYDMTLAALRARGPVLAIGIGLAAQEVAQVPREPHDQPLDGIVTELGARAFAGAGG